MTTYLVENYYTGTAYGYHSTLYAAKEQLKYLYVYSRPIEASQGVLRIVKLVGPEYGQGYHVYYCQYDIDRDRFIYDRY